MIDKQKISISIYRIIALIIGSIGIIEQAKGMTHPLVMFYFFTVLTNILCDLFLFFSVIRQKDNLMIEGGLVVSIVLVMLVFHFMLRPTSDFYQGEIGCKRLSSYCLVRYTNWLSCLCLCKSPTRSTFLYWLWHVKISLFLFGYRKDGS